MIKKGDLIRFKEGPTNFDVAPEEILPVVRVLYVEDFFVVTHRGDGPRCFHQSRFEIVDNALVEFLNADFSYD